MNIIKKYISRIKKKDCCLNCLYYDKCQGECIHPVNDSKIDISNIIGTSPLYYKCDKYRKSKNTHLFDSHINKLISDWVKDATCNSKYKYSNVMYNINRKHKKITIMTNIYSNRFAETDSFDSIQIRDISIWNILCIVRANGLLIIV